MSDAAQPTPPTPSGTTPYTSAPAASASPRYTLATVALVLGLVGLGLGIVSQLATVGVLRSGAFEIYALISALTSGVVLLLAIGALVVGLIAAGRTAARVRAGIVAVLVGGTLVFTMFPRNEREKELLAAYQAEDSTPA